MLRGRVWIFMVDVIIQVAVPGPFPQGLSYKVPSELQPVEQSEEWIGRRVSVPLRKREIVGIVVEILSPDVTQLDKLKPILAWIDLEAIIPLQLKKLIHFMRDYYHVSLGDAYYTALPSLICQGKPLKLKRSRPLDPLSATQNAMKKEITLNAEQQNALRALLQTPVESSANFSVHLLEGVTGSGKTEVYLKCVEQVLSRGGSVLVLVPEIGLTPQILARFLERLSEKTLSYHSGLTEAEKRDCWMHVRQGRGKVVIGTRSAVFLPFVNLGLIILDEEHDSSYKQQTGVHYSAKSIALMRGKQEDCQVILGSATPSVETYYFVKKGMYQHHVLKKRAVSQQNNLLKLIDMRKYKAIAGMSLPLLESMQRHLLAGNQVLIFLNRRGYAPVLMCSTCGERCKCDACDISYTLHQSLNRLLCHHCGRTERVPKKCNTCQAEMLTLGQGTEQLEEFIAEKFSGFKILRLDQDVTRQKGQLEQKLAEIKAGAVHIIIGTQMIAKGHDFPDITLVGIVDLDYGFFSPDFRGIERAGQLITQVAGRAGRGIKLGEVMIQTHVPDHPLLQCLLREGYAVFAERLLADRQVAGWPPFQYLALLRAEAKNQDRLFAFLKEIKISLSKLYKISISGPIPAFLKKKNNYHRAQLIIESEHRNVLHTALNSLETLKDSQNQVRLYLDVDPLEIG